MKHYHDNFPYQNEKWSHHIDLIFRDTVDWYIENLGQNEGHRLWLNPKNHEKPGLYGQKLTCYH